MNPRGQLVCPVATGDARRESDPVGQQYGVLRDGLARVEVLGHESRRHRLAGSGIDEALAGRSVDRKFLCRVERRDARQIADRVVVLVVGQPPQNDRPRIARVLLRLAEQKVPHPVAQLFLLGVVGLRRILRRHLSGVEHRADFDPHRRLLLEIGQRRELAEINLRFRRVAGVALEAELFQ